MTTLGRKTGKVRCRNKEHVSKTKQSGSDVLSKSQDPDEGAARSQTEAAGAAEHSPCCLEIFKIGANEWFPSPYKEREGCQHTQFSKHLGSNTVNCRDGKIHADPRGQISKCVSGMEHRESQRREQFILPAWPLRRAAERGWPLSWGLRE